MAFSWKLPIFNVFFGTVNIVLGFDKNRRVIKNLSSSEYSFQVVQCAIDLDIFDMVCEMSCTAQNLTEKNGYNSDATERLLNALASLKLVEKTTEDGAGQCLFG